VRYYCSERVASGKLADAAAQATAPMQRDERACWLLQKFLRGKIPQGRFVCYAESEGTPRDLQQQQLLAFSE
jgi:hypothetical protein